MIDHETYVQSGPWPFAACSCGWEGQPRALHSEAAEDAAAHGEPIEQPWLDEADDHLPSEEGS